MPDPRPPAIFLLGPTASGKTAIALALAQQLPAEIVSVDSAQVFIDMDIGTAKPDAAMRAACPHHLIDLITPEESYSAARFRDDALRVRADITRRGRVPLLAGGTMLCFLALREGLSQLPASDPKLRREIEDEARRRGWPALHAELAHIDAGAAARLNRNDAQRIQRALEIVRLTGEPLSAGLARRDESSFPYRVIALGLAPSARGVLHERIAARFDAMLRAGLVDEVAALREKYRLDRELPAMRSVGYRQAWAHLEGELDRDALREKGIVATRQLAKRQLTWLRAMRDVTVLDCLRADLAGAALAAVRRGLDAS